jgi:hypothetical protein
MPIGSAGQIVPSTTDPFRSDKPEQMFSRGPVSVERIIDEYQWNRIIMKELNKYILNFSSPN